MTFLNHLPPSPTGEYCCQINLDLFNSPECKELATQAAKGRHLCIIAADAVKNVLQVQLCEDQYQAWLPVHQLNALQPAEQKYQPIPVSRDEIEKRLPDVIAFIEKAMNTPNHYLWGGTVAPNYDCSGLIQAGFAAFGIWLPRNSYQQEAFTQRILREELLPGDLIFLENNESITLRCI